MAVPKKFLEDIQAKDTNIFSKFVIHTENQINHNLYYSTNKLTFPGIGMDNSKSVFWKPLLLKLPSVKEKYDIDTKKVIVSKINLSLSNASYDGERVSDILAQVGLVKKNVSIYYQSQSAKSNSDCLLVFYGEIRRVKHDAKKCTIEVHDLGAGLHRDLPQTYPDNLLGESTGKPIPINYGDTPYAPAVVQLAGTHYKVHFDTVRAYSGLNNPFETSGIHTGTANYKGFSKREGYQNPTTYWSHGPISIYKNNKYPELRIGTYGVFSTSSNYKDMFDGQGIKTQERYDAFGHGQTQHNYPEGDWTQSEPWVIAEEPYLKIYKTDQYISDNTLTFIMGYKPDSVSLSIIEADQENVYPSAMEEKISDLLETVSDGVYWEWNGGYDYLQNILPDFYTSDATGEDIPPENYPNTLYGVDENVGWSEFRVKLAEFTVGTDPGMDQKRVQHTRVYINGLPQYTTNMPNVCLEWNDEHQHGTGNQIQWPSNFKSSIGEDEDGNILYTYYDLYLGTQGSIQNAVDSGHYGYNIQGYAGVGGSLYDHPTLGGDAGTMAPGGWAWQPNQNPKNYPRELFAMHGRWEYSDPFPGFDNTLWGNDLAGSTLLNGTSSFPVQQPSFPPAFDFGCYSASTTAYSHYTIGVARLWGGATISNEWKCEWFQSFRDNQFSGSDYHPNPQINCLVTNTRFTSRLRQVDVASIFHIENPFDEPFVVSLRGRCYDDSHPDGSHPAGWSNGKWLRNPAEIIRSLVEVELEFYDFDEQDYQVALAEHSGWNFSCNVAENISSKELIEDISQYTKMFPKFGVDGKFRFNSIKKSYSESDWDGATNIEYDDLIDYKFELTKIEDVCSAVDLWYRYDYHNDGYAKRWADVYDYGRVSSGGDPLAGQVEPPGTVTSGYADFQGHSVGGRDYDGVAGWSGCNLPQMSDAELSFYNIDDIKNNVRKVECKYFSDWTDTTSVGETIMLGPGSGGDDYFNKFSHYTGYKVHDYLYNQFKNQHLVFKLKLPVKYVWVDVGKLLKFDKLFNGMSAYGINYTKFQDINMQFRYPLFFVTAVSKSVDHVEVTCMQLHWLGFDNTGVMGMTETDYDFWSSIIGQEPVPIPQIYPPFIPDPTDPGGPEEPIYGCMDTDATNYDPAANVSDGSCVYPLMGCMDPNAVNYDPDAVEDDGTCAYMTGCMDPSAINFTEDAVVDDGSCVYDWGESTGIQFGGQAEDTGDDIYFYKYFQSFQYADFTLDGTFGYGDLSEIDEAYSNFQGLVFPVGANDDGTPNDAFNWVFGFDGSGGRWTVNGQQISSLQELLFDGETDIMEAQFPDGTVLINVRIGPAADQWTPENTLIWDFTGLDLDEMDFVANMMLGPIIEQGSIVEYFLPWYGAYEWSLIIHWESNSYTLDWELSAVDGQVATNFWAVYQSISPITGNPLTVNKYAIGPTTSTMFDNWEALGMPYSNEIIINDQWEDYDAVLDAFPMLVDKNSIVTVEDNLGILMDYSITPTMDSLDFMATEITISFHDNLIQTSPDEDERVLVFYTLWTPEMTQPMTQLYDDPSSSEGGPSPGDVNLDGTANILDVVYFVNIIMGTADISPDEMTDDQFINADMNGDAELNVLDIVTLVNFILEGE